MSKNLSDVIKTDKDFQKKKLQLQQKYAQLLDEGKQKLEKSLSQYSSKLSKLNTTVTQEAEKAISQFDKTNQTQHQERLDQIKKTYSKNLPKTQKIIQDLLVKSIKQNP